MFNTPILLQLSVLLCMVCLVSCHSKSDELRLQSRNFDQEVTYLTSKKLQKLATREHYLSLYLSKIIVN
jgi:hypothetical protein